MAEANILGGLLGGALIGTAAALLLAINGRIAGISGIVGGLITSRERGERSWRLAFLLGLITGPTLYRLVYGELPLQMEADGPVLLAAGLLVGFGTRLGSGCTSGHGVCGLARLSPRSLAATLTFMSFGIATVYIVKNLF
ncbi:MAG TPA: YeeE/YedE family protein [Candidatus Binatia bacterium]|jgi:uncharacterized membrane protein YedE/YeeE